MTLKGMYYLQCQSSKEFHITHLSYIIHINKKNANLEDAHVKKRGTTFEYPSLD